jgi:uncharacterized membrane protein YqjE
MTSDRSISDILQDLIRNLQSIVRSEVRLAKTEVREEITKAKSAILLLGIGAVCGIFGALFLLLTIMYALKAGLKQMKRVDPVPDKTIESMKENAEWARQQAK